jgi:hypothetical protein
MKKLASVTAARAAKMMDVSYVGAALLLQGCQLCHLAEDHHLTVIGRKNLMLSQLSK